jgi:hypothetical protein
MKSLPGILACIINPLDSSIECANRESAAICGKLCAVYPEEI